MKFRADEITSVIQREIEQFQAEVTRTEVGRVLEVGDGIARVHGLSGVMTGEMVAFQNGVKGLAFNLEESSVGVIILGDYTQIHEGETVTATGELLRVPVGEAMVGRVVNPLGEPIDNKGPIATTETRLVESPAPGIADRQPVDEPMQTGIKAIDAMTPIGRGQRQLIIGDRKTGKTAIAIDAILNQKGTGVICVYVAVAQKESTTADAGRDPPEARRDGLHHRRRRRRQRPGPAPVPRPVRRLRDGRILHVRARASATLCVYDDLSKQAVAYRELSLLLRRPPGREAYPGDVFYAHSRLLERSAKLANKYVIVPDSTPADATIDETSGVGGKVFIGEPGSKRPRPSSRTTTPGHKVAKTTTSGGSLTALPLIETLEGEVSAYIPTNVISITDGQIYLQPDLFFAGVRPAVDVGISVSRVGGKAQIPAMKKVAGGLRLDLAAFRELEAFAQLGTELDKATQQQLDRGYRMVELLKQPQYQPMDVIDQVMSIYAGSEGYLDAVPIKEVSRFEEQFLAFMRDRKSDVRALLAKERKMTDEVVKGLKAALDEFKKQYRPAAPADAAADTPAWPAPRSDHSPDPRGGSSGSRPRFDGRQCESRSAEPPKASPTAPRRERTTMAKARAIVKRRKSVQNIRKITRTMELIATARFKKALDRATEAEAYTRKIAELVADLGTSAGDVSHPLLEVREPVKRSLPAGPHQQSRPGGRLQRQRPPGRDPDHPGLRHRPRRPAAGSLRQARDRLPPVPGHPDRRDLPPVRGPSRSSTRSRPWRTATSGCSSAARSTGSTSPTPGSSTRRGRRRSSRPSCR